MRPNMNIAQLEPFSPNPAQSLLHQSNDLLLVLQLLLGEFFCSRGQSSAGVSMTGSAAERLHEGSDPRGLLGSSYTSPEQVTLTDIVALFVFNVHGSLQGTVVVYHEERGYGYIVCDTHPTKWFYLTKQTYEAQRLSVGSRCSFK
eukprot:833945-Amphidinium_carterae.1